MKSYTITVNGKAYAVTVEELSLIHISRIKKVDTERIEAELDARRIVIVTGFQGINRYDDVTTLGRGGSDTSAVALAASLHADLCQIYTDVDGVYTADPRLVPHARTLEEVTYNEMLELATLGEMCIRDRRRSFCACWARGRSPWKGSCWRRTIWAACCTRGM